MKAISDIHLDPGQTYPGDLHGVHILNGDTFNILPYGMREWKTLKGMLTVQSLTDAIDPETVFIVGNHEGRLSWLQELVPDHRVVRSLDFPPYHFEHGHRFSEWRWLSYVADDLVEYLTTNPLTRKLWWKFCLSKGWMATGLPHSSDKHNRLVELVWSWASYEATKAGMVYVIGHTHEPADLGNVIDLGCNEIAELPC